MPNIFKEYQQDWLKGLCIIATMKFKDNCDMKQEMWCIYRKIFKWNKNGGDIFLITMKDDMTIYKLYYKPTNLHKENVCMWFTSLYVLLKP